MQYLLYIPNNLLWVWFMIYPVDPATLDHHYVMCDNMYSQAISNRDMVKMKNVVILCTRFDISVDQ